jgi:multidrug transporter EmrE-like cation transporter
MLVLMKITPGFKEIHSSILLVIFLGFSLFFEKLAIEKIDLTISYAVWVGSGLVAITIIDYFYFNLKINTIGIVSLIAIVFFMTLLSFKGLN